MTEALLVVDVQRTFVTAVGDAGPDVVDAVNLRIDATLAAGGAVFYTRDVQPGSAPPDDPANALADELRVRGPVIEKGPGRPGGFSGFVLASDEPGSGGLSALAGALASAGTTRVTVVGLAADVCVAATARDAVRLGYPTAVALDATAFVHAHPDGDEAAIDDLRAAGVDVG